MKIKRYIISKETRARCRIFQLSEAAAHQFQSISLELFHYLLEVKAISFTIYFRVDDEMIEFIVPASFSHQLVHQIIAARNREYDNVDICVEAKDFKRFEALINEVREKKIEQLLRRDPLLDPQVIRSFVNLSRASQMMVRGGLSPQVAAQAREAASILVSSLMECEVAVGTLSRMVQADPTLYDHSASVAMMSGVIARTMLGRNREDSVIITQSGLYHDVGKTCVPHSLLNKPGRFTPEEFERMKLHTTLGYEEICRAIEQGSVIDRNVARVALEHHEKFNGRGYPFGRKGRAEEHEHGIHLFARIVSIADVYSALLMKRVYKEAYSASEALSIMHNAAADYDPIIFRNFEKHIQKTLIRYDVLEKKALAAGKIIMVDPGLGTRIRKNSA
ncbi:HD-GYP domain-containing protein [Oligoflexus tunisiensis]|uniref:HD-GYP domain-containing protein n=1 Tax=Oligoflexus tunisiensis TaxID=708132 RepID=UPI00159F04DF|nr:HD domain-containing phosphohydrolase [Oligoflexus tunisiensis]